MQPLKVGPTFWIYAARVGRDPRVWKLGRILFESYSIAATQSPELLGRDAGRRPLARSYAGWMAGPKVGGELVAELRVQ